MAKIFFALQIFNDKILFAIIKSKILGFFFDFFQNYFFDEKKSLRKKNWSIATVLIKIVPGIDFRRSQNVLSTLKRRKVLGKKQFQILWDIQEYRISATT